MYPASTDIRLCCNIQPLHAAGLQKEQRTESKQAGGNSGPFTAEEKENAISEAVRSVYRAA